MTGEPHYNTNASNSWHKSDLSCTLAVLRALAHTRRERLHQEGTMSKWYEFVWSRIGGRPWTYIIRDWYKDYPLVWIAAITSIGVVLGHIFW